MKVPNKDVPELTQADLDDLRLRLHEQVMSSPPSDRVEARLRKAIMPDFLEWLRDEVNRGSPAVEVVNAIGVATAGMVALPLQRYRPPDPQLQEELLSQYLDFYRAILALYLEQGGYNVGNQAEA